MGKFKTSNGFTLLELLTVSAIVVILTAIAIPVVHKVKQNGEMTRELSGAKKLIAGYLAYAVDHDGEVMVGYHNSAVAVDQDGAALKFPINARYPWRVAPYLNYEFAGSVLVNQMVKLLSQPGWEYAVSAEPSFGLNVTYVGGDFGSGSELNPDSRMGKAVGDFVVTRLVEAVAPSKLLVFSSARQGSGIGEALPGNFMIRAPNLMQPRWEDGPYNKGLHPQKFGFVDFRYQGQAVCAMLDGHVEMLGVDELRDMRRWSNQAADVNNPNHILSRNEP